MQRFRFQSVLPKEGSSTRVDREKRIVYGVQMLAIGEAKGHGVLVDSVMLKQAADAVNAAGETGLKSRFTHPGMCADGMGKQLGRMKNARVEGDQAIADLHLSEFASRAPEGDLAGYVMDVAEQDPNACGMSIVFSGTPVWKDAEGKEMAALSQDGRAVPAPEGATSKMPFARISKMNAVDIVDEPAATSGLLAAAFSSTSSADAAKAFAVLDDLRSDGGLSLEQAHQFLTRYFTARGYEPKDKPMTISAERMAELCEKHPAEAVAIAKSFAAGKTEAEVVSAIESNERAALAAKVAELETKLAAAHVEAEEAKVNLGKLKALSENIPPDCGSQAAGAGSGDPLKAEWEAMSAAKKLGYFDQFEVFAEAKRIEAIDAANTKA